MRYVCSLLFIFLSSKFHPYLAAQTKISTKVYQAIVNESGLISSLQIGGCEVLREPIQFCVGTN
ncbi:MAG: hypothetical protein NZ781_12190, partial [Armatimonadetes bacterium]|nr:hypothetical protein [Armatimonadota bacterium]